MNVETSRRKRREDAAVGRTGQNMMQTMQTVRAAAAADSYALLRFPDLYFASCLRFHADTDQKPLVDAIDVMVGIEQSVSSSFVILRVILRADKHCQG